MGLQGPQVVVSRHLIVATASAAPSSHYRAPPWMAMVGQLSSVEDGWVGEQLPKEPPLLYIPPLPAAGCARRAAIA